jgi:DNA-binding transcriptional LysR family regulator
MVALTDAGAALHAETAPLLARLERSLEHAPPDRVPKGLLRLSASTDLGAVLMGAALPRFVARYPSLRVDLRLSNRLVDLVADGFDAAVRGSARQLADSSLMARTLAKTEMQLFASPDYLGERGTPQSFEEALAHEWVTFPRWKPPYPLRKLPPPRLMGDDFFFIREALRAGGGIGVLPVFLAGNDLRAGTLVRVLPQWTETRGSSRWSTRTRNRCHASWRCSATSSSTGSPRIRCNACPPHDLLRSRRLTWRSGSNR